MIASLLLLAVLQSAPDGEPPPSVAERTAGLERRAGLLELFVDRRGGRVWLALPPPDERGVALRCLLSDALTSGLGSNPVGLDRGRIGDTRVVAFRRVGARVLVEAENAARAAATPRPAEVLAARESFATSVLWGGEVAALDEDGRALVDLSGFVVRDAHGVARALKESGQGAFELDPARSALDLSAVHAFPENVELEALLTFASDEPGPEVRATAPAPEAVTLVQHLSLIALPDAGYRPRAHDPRTGANAVVVRDLAAPLEESVARPLATRHRLVRTDPDAPRSGVVEPIVFHVDAGAPEPVRSALVEGAGWWAEAFEAAGFEGAYRVELLPADAHPLDARLHVLQWVHRETRGWSYGGGVVDPRTGEIVKGHVRLGSLRVRQDRLLMEGLVGADATGSGAANDPVRVALARLRQLAAHEVGHALGLAHNFAASTYGRASVMDYPCPRVAIAADGSLDLSDAYAVGVGAWDRHAIRWLYAEVPAAELDRIARAGVDAGLLFLSDGDARDPATAHPLASLWDDGPDAVAGLEHALAVRRVALERFGVANVRPGVPLAHLQEVLAPLYLHHRYELEAALKLVGGVEYAHAVRGDGQSGARAVDPARQRRALRAVLAALDPARLDLPEDLLARLLPRPPEAPPSRELLAGATAPVFDPLAAAGSAADLVARGLLLSERCARLVDQHRRDPEQLGLLEVLDALVERVAPAAPPAVRRQGAVLRAARSTVVARLIERAGDPAAPLAVRAQVEHALLPLARLEVGVDDPEESAERRSLAREITRFLERPAEAGPRPAPAPPEPPGSPIGSPARSGCSQGG